jgi:hypothetical protein
MTSAYRVLICGASYGALLGTKIAAAGHSATLLCRPATAKLINTEGVRVHFPTDDHDVIVESSTLPGRLSAVSPSHLDIAFDLVVLAMQEPQYNAVELRSVLSKIATAGIPCMSIMNMPLLPYLARLPIDATRVLDAYSDPGVWGGFDSDLITWCSPDAQAFRPFADKPNVLQVRLATNFKTAPFARREHTDILRRLQQDIDDARFTVGKAHDRELPVKVRVHDSVFIPLAKWGMLLTGNYRCIHGSGLRSIAVAVHEDVAAARSMYDWVLAVCRRVGARDEDLVPFDKYAKAARALTAPSSAARALAGGATSIERVDRLVQGIAAGFRMQSAELDRTVDLVDSWLAANRREQRTDPCSPIARVTAVN